jgi:hypothetical protein
LVDRYAYLTRFDDSSTVKLIKEVMTIILDKIDDVSELIRIKEEIILDK